MKFRIARTSKSNAGRLLEVRSVSQFENGRVSVLGHISGRMASWEGTLGVTINFDDAEAAAWLLDQNIDWIRHGRWLDAYNAEQAQILEKERKAREIRQARAREEVAIITAAERKYAAAVRAGEMIFDGTPQVATVPNRPDKRWVQAWVAVEVSL